MNLIIITLILSVLILVHEAGHYLAARWMGISITRFSLGFGKTLWSFNDGETEFRLAAFPLGGYVLTPLRPAHSQFAYPVVRRIFFTLGGPLANLLICIPLFALLNALSGEVTVFSLLVSPWLQTGSVLVSLVMLVPQIITQPAELTGIIGMLATESHAVANGLIPVLGIAIMLSLNFCVLNLLPIPPLDGGKILLLLLEWIYPPSIRLQMHLHMAGWGTLFCLVAYLFLIDIQRFFGAIQ